MALDAKITPDEIRQHILENPKMRARDLADQIGVGEAALVAAQGARRINASPDAIMPALTACGLVMGLTRNISAVHEKVGVYDNYHSGDHASMVLNHDIDLRIFASHWVHGFAVTTETDAGPRHSVQVFDAAGDAIHKVFSRDGTDLPAFEAMMGALATGDTSDMIDLRARAAVEVAKADASKVDILRKEWTRMTDTHQFMRLTSKLKMNRLGAYRIAGAPFVKPLAPWALNDALVALGQQDTQIMCFVGNRGCIQIHTGPVNTVSPMGPWQNVMDPEFNLHLRTDHIAEVWAVEKPTKRGPAISIEAFDQHGALILQMFGRRKESDTIDDTAAFGALIETLPTLHSEDA
ncbi:hemin-degrading factor [Thalassobium sp. R2A62]|uniref:hemin-degrading factor n=1 Tax=Thalassobium sp. R2A62 TaxID=633131 RepID=UPI0001B1CAAC|nr:hemin-degrading factor [Thalassobium sp. R2A62]EET47331.1 hemin transport protein HmuS [Thalassobium sp. R2A62]